MVKQTPYFYRYSDGLIISKRKKLYRIDILDEKLIYFYKKIQQVLPVTYSNTGLLFRPY